MMKKIVTLLALSQLALAGALYASDGAWNGSGANEARATAVAEKRAGSALAHPVDEAENCASYAWPRIPGRCLNAQGDGVLRSAGKVRHIALN